MEYKPLFDLVIIEREVKEKIGSIILPTGAGKQIAKAEGVIKALGPDAHESLKVGDKVIFGKYAGHWLDNTTDARTGTEKDDGKLYICKDIDVMCVLQEDAE